MGWNADEGSEFEEFISYLEEQTEAALDAQDAIDDISDSVDEIEQRGRDATSEIYDQVKEGLVKQYENQITELENINNSIQEASADMISKMQEQIDDARKARDREKAQSQITDKQTRLAYLKADSSGMNALEIASLEKEISDAQESYTDSLIDEAIEKLQEDNEKAAEQRQEQIDLQRSQLEAYVDSGKIWEEVQRITNEGFAQVAKGVPFAETEAGHLADLAADLKTANPIRQEEIRKSLDESAKLATIYGGFAQITGDPAGTLNEVIKVLQSTLTKLRDEADDPPPNVTISNPTGTGEDTDEDDGNLGDDQQPPKEEPSKPSEPSETEPEPEITPKPSNPNQNSEETVIPDETKEPQKPEKPVEALISYGELCAYYPGIMTEKEFNRKDRSDQYSSYQDYLNKKYEELLNTEIKAWTASREGALWDTLNTEDLINNKKDAATWYDSRGYRYTFTAQGPSNMELSSIAALKERAGIIKDCSIINYNNQLYAYKNKHAYPIIKSSPQSGGSFQFTKYATGGLADFTGPAWLDGTKSKPEIVLNQTDSANFMQLRDILADIFNGSSTTSQEGGKGDNYFDIEISVESLGDDYDVEQLADKIRGMIYDDATYRNVNTINSIR